MSGALTELVAQRFRLLGEPMRLRILQTLEGGEQPVSAIVEALESSQPNISKHLQALLQGGLIRRRREGLNIFYSIADPMVFRLCELVCSSAAQQTRARLVELDLPNPARRAPAGRR
ncbi:MAG TPA: metalloregulator ArsR/SmtB family transcription factor [Candidatus Angelobacter sp.]|nr:metalloregulator ArsR/SmtB family transcription factor [Candidatus Angelobacter sp.]